MMSAVDWVGPQAVADTQSAANAPPDAHATCLGPRGWRPSIRLTPRERARAAPRLLGFKKRRSSFSVLVLNRGTVNNEATRPEALAGGCSPLARKSCARWQRLQAADLTASGTA